MKCQITKFRPKWIVLDPSIQLRSGGECSEFLPECGSLVRNVRTWPEIARESDQREVGMSGSARLVAKGSRLPVLAECVEEVL